MDYKDIYARAQFMIETLCECYICEGWNGSGLDEVAAEKILRYLERHANDPTLRSHSPTEHLIIDFCIAHGQNYDWLFTGSLRGFIAQGAAESPRVKPLPGVRKVA
jgi:hypothetical protein